MDRTRDPWVGSQVLFTTELNPRTKYRLILVIQIYMLLIIAIIVSAYVTSLCDKLLKYFLCC